MIKKALVSLAVMALSGCAVKYAYEGQKYNNKEEFRQAVDANISNALATITPLPSPLSQKKLIFALPSEATFVEESSRRYVALQGSQLTGPAKEASETLSRSNFKNIKVFFDAVQKKNIYKSVQFVEMQSMSGSFAASADTDALYMVEPSQGSTQWFYISDKHGKQIFAYDRSSPNSAGKLQAFVDAVQAQAIRD